MYSKESLLSVMLQASRLLWLQHTLRGLDVRLGCVVWHWYADHHIQGKQLVVEGALRLHIHLQSNIRFLPLAFHHTFLLHV